MTSRAAHLTTRQQWVLQAVADGRIHHDRLYGDLAPFDLDGHPVDWTITALAVRGLVTFDPLLPSPPHLTRRGTTTLAGRAPRGTTHRAEGGHG